MKTTNKQVARENHFANLIAIFIVAMISIVVMATQVSSYAA